MLHMFLEKEAITQCYQLKYISAWYTIIYKILVQEVALTIRPHSSFFSGKNNKEAVIWTFFKKENYWLTNQLQLN
jgi:hypothetical protein